MNNILKKFRLLIVFLCAFIPASILCAGSQPDISDLEKKLAVNFVKEYKGVLDASVKQEGHRISLSVTVDYDIDQAGARQIGDNFVRLVKTFSRDASPGRTIGKGFYDYEVEVFLPDQTLLVRGAKVDFVRQISWSAPP